MDQKLSLTFRCEASSQFLEEPVVVCFVDWFYKTGKSCNASSI